MIPIQTLRPKNRTFLPASGGCSHDPRGRTHLWVLLPRALLSNPARPPGAPEGQRCRGDVGGEDHGVRSHPNSPELSPVLEWDKIFLLLRDRPTKTTGDPRASDWERAARMTPWGLPRQTCAGPEPLQRSVPCPGAAGEGGKFGRRERLQWLLMALRSVFCEAIPLPGRVPPRRPRRLASAGDRTKAEAPPFS